jgi:tetratricopeptide (TPR) repeat protein
VIRTLPTVSVVLALVLAVFGEGARAQAPPPQAPPARPPAASAEVERRLLEAVRRTPDAFAAHHALGEFYLHAGKVAAAIPHLERARALDPAHDSNGHDLALAYLETGRLDAARDQVRRMLAAKETGELLNLLGDVDARAGDFAAAAVGYQRAAHLQPTEEHLFDWGDNLLRLRAYDDAVDVFTASLRRHPASARLHIGLGIAQYSRSARRPTWRRPIRARTCSSARCTAWCRRRARRSRSGWPGSSRCGRATRTGSTTTR